MAEVSFDHDSFAYIRVCIKLFNSPKMAYFNYKADSGANRTTISSKILNDLGYDNEWIKTGKLLIGDERPTVATGAFIDDCYIVSLPEITIGDYVGYNWSFLTSLSVPYRNLLGTDTMNYFNWEFNYEKNFCRYNIIPSKRTVLFNQKEQSMHSLDGIDFNIVE